MKLALVVPRDSVRGGSENALRMTGEAMARHAGWQVDLYTTCATSTDSWADGVAAGTEERNGITVHRYRVDSGRLPEWGPLNERIKLSPSSARRDEEVHFFEWQGPVSRDLLDAVTGCDADLVWFAPYLYWPTIMGVAAVRGRALLHPAAHEEPYLRLPAISTLLRSVNGLVYASASERATLERHHRVGHVPEIVLGWGIDTTAHADGDESAARQRAGVGDRPYLLCVGRIEHAKGTVTLARYWDLYKQRNPGPLTLVLAGDRTADVTPTEDLVIAESVDDATKWGLLDGAIALVNPSAMEAFSLVLFEAWHTRTPVLVNARCAATAEHATVSQGGLGFDDYPSFEAAVDRIVADADTRRRMGDAGHDYGATRYSWPAIAGRFAEFCDRARRHRPTG